MIAHMIARLRAMIGADTRLRILLLLLAVLLIVILALGLCSRQKPEIPPSSDEASHPPAAPVTVHPARYPVYQGCWTMDLYPIVSIRLHQDPQSGEPVAQVAFAPKEETANIEWRADPLSFAGLEEKGFAVDWDPPVLTLTHPIETVAEWAWFNADRFPEGLEQVLTYVGDRATLRIGDMAARLVEAGTAVRYRIRFRRAQGPDEDGVFVSHDPAYPFPMVAEVVYWSSTRVFTLGEEGFEISLLPNVDGDAVFANPAASGWVTADARMLPILQGRAINFRSISLRDAAGRPLDSLPRGAPVFLVAEAASHCPYAAETARLQMLADNFSPFDDAHPWENRFIDLIETGPASGIFVTPEPFVLDWPVLVLFEGEERPYLRLVPEGLGSSVPEEAGRVFRLSYAADEGKR